MSGSSSKLTTSEIRNTARVASSEDDVKEYEDNEEGIIVKKECQSCIPKKKSRKKQLKKIRTKQPQKNGKMTNKK